MERLIVILNKIHGLSENDEGKKIVIIDPRQPQKELLKTAIHEGLHIALPQLSEEEVLDAEGVIAEIPWLLGFRRRKNAAKFGKWKGTI